MWVSDILKDNAKVGEIRTDGQTLSYAPDIPLLKNLSSEPVHDYQFNEIPPTDPVAFVKALHITYSGSRLRASEAREELKGKIYRLDD